MQTEYLITLDEVFKAWQGLPTGSRVEVRKGDLCTPKHLLGLEVKLSLCPTGRKLMEH